ncbi:hypothetical protein MIR68_007170 [Amoeboaphelidium protococcarum]|nr:hypothetical protein MIR68_007170 [Amoeboaphelidium protococcarum]
MTIDTEIKRKTGILKRYKKDLQYYETELKQHQDKVDKLRSCEEGDNAGEQNDFLVRKATELLRETEKLIPDIRNRVNVTYQELYDLCHADCVNKNGQEYKDAMDLLQDTDPRQQ